jgi:trimeric autotransporter adhesin
LRGERDASARATHLEAATRKFLVTTNERKQMSTKTNFKRIALVAIAALGLGVLSSVPSQALLGAAPTVTVTDGTAGLAGVRTDSTNAARIVISGLLDQASNDADSITVTVVARSIGTGITPVVGLQYLDSSTPSIASSTFVDTIAAQANVRSAARAGTSVPFQAVDTVSATGSGIFRITSGSGTKNVTANFGLQMDSATSTRVAGTAGYTVLVRYIDLNGVTQTISRDVNIVIAAAADASATVTSTYGFAQLSSTTIADGATQAVDSTINASATSGTTRGFLFVAVRNAANGFATANDSLTATVTGVGLVCSEAGTCGKSLSKISVTGDYQFTLQGDGNGGTSTVVVTSGVTGVSYSKQLTYYATAAKTLTASVLTPVLKIGANDSAVAVTAVDAAGAVWGGTAYIVASAAADATAVGGSATTPVACVFRASNGTHYCPISAVSAGTGKFKVIDAATVALATATSNEVTVKSSAALAATVKISFNKANYAPGEVGMIMITPLDATGGAMPAGSVTTSALSSGGITSNVGLSYNTAAVTLTGTTITTDAYTGTTTVAGSQVIFFNAPVGGGSITLTAKGGSGLPLAGQVALTATATVTDNGAAALAAVNALATTVASLKTLITTLTNLVLKIQKKVKA